jgi:hypothetical protein
MSSRAFGPVLWVVAAAFAGGASAQEAAPNEAAKTEDADTASAAAEQCFDITRARDVSVLSDEHVYVRTIGGNHYLLTMAQVCANLQRSYRSDGVRIQPYGRRVCPNDGSHLLYSWFGQESVCPILTVDPVVDRAEANAIAEGARRSPVEIEAITLPD